MPPKRMTANPIRPARYRPGKAVAEYPSSSEASEAESETEQTAQTQPTQRAPPPKATSFPTGAKPITSNLKSLDLEERRRQADKQEQIRLARERARREQEERDAGFVTDEDDEGSEEEDDENVLRHGVVAGKPKGAPAAARPGVVRPPAENDDEEDEEDSDDDDDSDSEEDSSDSDAPKLLRPVFLSKTARAAAASASARPPSPTPEEKAEIEANRRAAQADALVQSKLEEAAALRLAGRKDWDDDTAISALPDDTDGLDPALEKAQWVARELARVKRARAVLEQQEAEREEVERRRNMSAAEREAEDRAYIEGQKAEKEGKEKAGFMARYHHRGAFFMDEDGEGGKDGEGESLATRNLMGAKYADHEGMRETLPEYLQVRDVTKIGRKGRTKYKDMRAEDTGRFGDFRGSDRGVGYNKGRGEGDKGLPMVDDERFRPDKPSGPFGATGANAKGLGDGSRKRGFGDEGRDRERDDAKRVRAGD